MEFTLQGTDPRFLYLKRRLEADGHTLVPDSKNVIAPPSERRGVAYYRDGIYTLRNAALTAEGALELIMRRSADTVAGMEALVVGYGRIGRLLSDMLSALGARVTVAARDAQARAEAQIRRHHSVDIISIPGTYDVVVNTVPAQVLTGDYGAPLCIDLASAPGGWEVGTSVLKAPGLPGIYAPRAAADVMAEAIYRVMEEKEHG